MVKSSMIVSCVVAALFLCVQAEIGDELDRRLNFGRTLLDDSFWEGWEEGNENWKSGSSPTETPPVGCPTEVNVSGSGTGGDGGTTGDGGDGGDGGGGGGGGGDASGGTGANIGVGVACATGETNVKSGSATTNVNANANVVVGGRRRLRRRLH